MLALDMSLETQPRPSPPPSPIPWWDVLASWLVARVIVLTTLLAVRFVQQEVLRGPAHVVLHTRGLLGWDAGWYDRIAVQGYDHLPEPALRFFPLLPLAARGLGSLLGGHDGAALLLLANGSALLYAVLLHRLAIREGLSETAARRVVWVAALAPAGFVLVTGYAEAPAGCLLVGALLALRDRHWLLAAVLSALGGALRPTGVLVVLPALVEAARGLRDSGVRQWAARALAVAAPALGLGSYLLWSAVYRGDALLPLTVQSRAGLRGGIAVAPWTTVVHAVEMLPHRLSATVWHLPWVVVAAVLLLVVARRLPSSYFLLSAATLLLAVTARELSSFERYAAGAAPLLLAAALVLEPSHRPKVTAVARAMAPALLAVWSLLAFTAVLTP
jgi:hypothetical protein